MPFFDARGTAIDPKDYPEINSGSKLRITYTCFPYHNAATNKYGVSLRLEAIKILSLTEGYARDAADYGLDGEEEGWVMPAGGPVDLDAVFSAGEDEIPF